MNIEYKNYRESNREFFKGVWGEGWNEMIFQLKGVCYA